MSLSNSNVHSPAGGEGPSPALERGNTVGTELPAARSSAAAPERDVALVSSEERPARPTRRRPTLEPFEGFVVAAGILAVEGLVLALLGENLVGAAPKLGAGLQVLGGGLLALVTLVVALPVALGACVSVADRGRRSADGRS